jgi:ubiquinone/menaquinone biosynthesis C-methylase UbiE
MHLTPSFALQPYQYLVESIRKFPKQKELEGMMREAGMHHVSHSDILGGVVAIHSGFKP